MAKRARDFAQRMARPHILATRRGEQHDLELLAEEMHNHGVTDVAVEETGHDADSRRLAERTGATLVEIPLRLGPGGSATGSYEGMLRILVERLDDALRR